MLYLITYAINKDRDNTAFYNAIQNLGEWWHYIDNTWIIRSNETANQLYQRLSSFSGININRLLIIKIDENNKQGWLPREAWDWINQNSS